MALTVSISQFSGGVTAQPEAASVREIANYLIWLIGKYGQQAQVTLGDTSGGGSLTPGGGTTLANPIDWIVSTSVASATAPLADGEDTVTFDGTNGMPDLRGYNMEFSRNNQPQFTTNPGDGTTYYSWNRTTGVFSVLNGAALETERMRILPTK